MTDTICSLFQSRFAPAYAYQERLSTTHGRISPGRNLKMKDGESVTMTVLFLGLNEDRDGWEKLGYVEDGEIREDRTGDLEYLLEGLPYLDDEHHCGHRPKENATNNHYGTMVEVIIYIRQESEFEEAARVTIEGEVLGDSPTADALRERLANDPRLDRYTDGRDLLQYIKTSYTTGYQVAVYASEESKQIVEELSHEAYAVWRATTEYDTQL